jgi:predicted MFS family arabinose efflux permease
MPCECDSHAAMTEPPPPAPPAMREHATPRLAFVVLGLAFLMMALARGTSESFTVFLLPLSQDFGWDRAQAVSVYSIGAVCFGLAAPFVGRLFDHSGPRAVYAIGLFLLGAGFTAAAYARELWQLQLCVGLVAGLGSACLGNVTSSLLLNRWFGRKLPTALAIVASSVGLGVLVLVPLTQILVDQFGWRGAYLILGGAMLAVTVPLLLLPWRRISAGDAQIVRPAQARAADTADNDWTLRSALRHHAFWALFSIFFFTSTGMLAISVQVVTYLVEVGFPPLQAATAWGFSGLLLVIGMLTVSWLDGVLGRRRAILLAYGVTLAGIVMLWALSRYPNIWLLGGFLLCFGSTMGSRGPLVSAAAMSIFRGKRLGTIMGTISIGSGIGAAIGSWAGGLIHDWSQSYDLVFAFAMCSVVLGMLPFLVAPALRE